MRWGTSRKDPRKRDVYQKHALNDIIIEELELSIRQKVCAFWCTEKKITLQRLAFRKNLLLRVQEGKIILQGTPQASNGQAAIKHQSTNRKLLFVSRRTDVKNIESRRISGPEAAWKQKSSGTPVMADQFVHNSNRRKLLVNHEHGFEFHDRRRTLLQDVSTVESTDITMPVHTGLPARKVQLVTEK